MLPNAPGRFAGRVESYRRFRPRYPAEIVESLRRDCELCEDASVVDVAAGTGLLTEIFLAAGFQVTAVEPNAEMRAACAELEGSYPRLRCVSGTAENTALPVNSAHLITVAQAMHWFDLERARNEFQRVLKPGGWCAIVYNNRRMGGDSFHEAYEKVLCEFGIDYVSVQQQHVGDERLAKFFAPAEMKRAVFTNSQALTLEGFEGRLLSSSYIPRPGEEIFPEMQAELKRIFDQYQQRGEVTIRYDCVVSYGRLGS
jgi:ubiquinone/menaquinone biosynthesis C-methylase UbiE